MLTAYTRGIKWLRRWFNPSKASISAGLGAIALALVLALPGQATQLQVNPTTPQLGDTISVILQADAPLAANPTVSFQAKTYPMFPMGGDRYRALLPTTPLNQPGAKQIQVNADGRAIAQTITLRNRSFPTQRITVAGGGSGGSELEMSRVRAFKDIVTPDKRWNGPFERPNAGGVSSVYGVRRYYNGVFADDYYHKGVDYAGGSGSPIVAPAGGRVVLVGRVADGFRLHGNTIGIDHGQGVASIFIHLSRIDVNEGDEVRPGQVIGALGATGSATGPNLHWGLYVNGDSVDPVPWRYDGFE